MVSPWWEWKLMSGTYLALTTSLKKREHSGFKNRNKNEFSTGKMWASPCLRYNIPQSRSRTSLQVGRLEPEAPGEADEGRGSCQLQWGCDPDTYHAPEKSMELHFLPLLILSGQCFCYALLTAEAWVDPKKTYQMLQLYFQSMRT